MAGRITGKLVVENKLEVGATAVIRADIVAKSIAVAKGAVIDGAVTVTSGAPVIEFGLGAGLGKCTARLSTQAPARARSGPGGGRRSRSAPRNAW